jgi:hypothetical protein
MDWVHVGGFEGALAGVDPNGRFIAIASGRAVTVYRVEDLAPVGELTAAAGDAIAIAPDGRVAAAPVPWLVFTARGDLIAFDAAGGRARVRQLDPGTGRTLVEVAPVCGATAYSDVAGAPFVLDRWYDADNAPPVVAPAPASGVVLALNSGDSFLAMIAVEVEGGALRVRDGDELRGPLRDALFGQRVMGACFVGPQRLVVVDSDQCAATLRWDGPVPVATSVSLPSLPPQDDDPDDADAEPLVFNGLIAWWGERLAMSVEQLTRVAAGWDYLPVGVAVASPGSRELAAWLPSPVIGRAQLRPLADGVVAVESAGEATLWRWR